MSNNSNFQTSLKEFKRSVEITRDVRFQANLRLINRQSNSNYLIAVLSIFVIGLSLFPNIIVLAPYQSQILLACSIVLSVFIIFTSLFDGAQNFYHQGELLHQCARKIARIHYDLKNIDPNGNEQSGLQELISLQLKYQSALDDCPINHANIDFKKTMIRKPHLFAQDFSDKFFERSFKHIWIRAEIFVLSVLWIIPHLFAMVLVMAVVYFFIVHDAKFIS